MADREHGAIPQGLIEQARARSVDPGKLQLLGKQAAALYSSAGTSLTDSVVDAIGKEDLGPEHARRVCEFANQEAFKNEWEKGGSVRNIEFAGGPADPADVLRELNDGARTDAIRVVSDYDDAPIKTASINRVEEEIFAGFTNNEPHPSEVPAGMPDLARLRTEIIGAQDHIFSKVAGLEVAKERLGIDFAQAISDEVLDGMPMQKIAQVVSQYATDRRFFQEAFDLAHDRLAARGIEVGEMEKLADARSIPNEEHPVLLAYVGFEKVAVETSMLRKAVDVLDEQRVEVDQAIEKLALGGVGRMAIGSGLLGAGVGAVAADPGQRLQGAVKGGLIGAGAGAGMAYGGLRAGSAALKARGVNPKALREIRPEALPAASERVAKHLGEKGVKQVNRAELMGGGAGLVAGGGAGMLAGQAIPSTPRRRQYR
ncbi:MAG: hypothetical protein KAY24_04995 [Candidatus Eisenbacteria sp.]|nr:hypothetical protein [Candidatus Eisenbacteria bacterium]